MMIFHVTALDDWRAAEVKGSYTLSTRGKTLTEVGFIHCSTAAQVVGVANLIYRGVHGLVLLVIDRARVHAPIRDEPAPIRDEPPDRGDAERFPHI